MLCAIWVKHNLAAQEVISPEEAALVFQVRNFYSFVAGVVMAFASNYLTNLRCLWNFILEGSNQILIMSQKA